MVFGMESIRHTGVAKHAYGLWQVLVDSINNSWRFHDHLEGHHLSYGTYTLISTSCSGPRHLRNQPNHIIQFESKGNMEIDCKKYFSPLERCTAFIKHESAWYTNESKLSLVWSIQPRNSSTHAKFFQILTNSSLGTLAECQLVMFPLWSSSSSFELNASRRTLEKSPALDSDIPPAAHMAFSNSSSMLLAPGFRCIPWYPTPKYAR